MYRKEMYRAPIASMAALCLLLGCGQGGGGGPDAGIIKRVPIDDFVSAFSKAYCDALGFCCTNAGIPYGQDVCVAQMTLSAQQILAQVHPLRTYDDVGAGQCVDAMQSMWSSCALSPDQIDPKTACDAVFAGTVAPGGACQSDNDCAKSADGPMRCEPDATMPVPPMPVCVLDRPGQIGEPCHGTAPPDPNVHFPHLACQDELFCDATNHCQTRVGAGAACGPSQECASNLFCETPTGPEGTCVAKIPLGGPCRDGIVGECLSGVCYQQSCAAGVPVGPKDCSVTPS
jgi:hypothetical protein